MLAPSNFGLNTIFYCIQAGELPGFPVPVHQVLCIVRILQGQHGNQVIDCRETFGEFPGHPLGGGIGGNGSGFSDSSFSSALYNISYSLSVQQGVVQYIIPVFMKNQNLAEGSQVFKMQTFLCQAACRRDLLRSCSWRVCSELYIQVIYNLFFRIHVSIYINATGESLADLDYI